MLFSGLIILSDFFKNELLVAKMSSPLGVKFVCIVVSIA